MSIPKMGGKMEFSEVVHRTVQSFRASPRLPVIPRQSADCRGNPPVEKYRRTIPLLSPVQGQLLMHIVP